MNFKGKVIVALDTTDLNKIKEIIDNLFEFVDIYKIGYIPYLIGGNELLKFINSRGKKVFLDFKLYDIPSVVSRFISEITSRYDIFMLTLHCSGGRKMLEGAVKASNNTLLIGVTVVTTFDENDLREIGIKNGITQQVKKLAIIAKECGLSGVVCSWKETKIVKDSCGDDFIVITPGLSAEHSRKIDFKNMRVSPDYIVIGRKIIQSKDPINELKKFFEQWKMTH